MINYSFMHAHWMMYCNYEAMREDHISIPESTLMAFSHNPIVPERQREQHFIPVSFFYLLHHLAVIYI